jgi:hypothetical protein
MCTYIVAHLIPVANLILLRPRTFGKSDVGCKKTDGSELPSLPILAICVTHCPGHCEREIVAFG